jgi:hypothetical protein
MVLLTHEPSVQFSTWRDVKSSLKGTKDNFWVQKKLRQYVMFVPMKKLFEPRSED